MVVVAPAAGAFARQASREHGGGLTLERDTAPAPGCRVGSVCRNVFTGGAVDVSTGEVAAGAGVRRFSARIALSEIGGVRLKMSSRRTHEEARVRRKRQEGSRIWTRETSRTRRRHPSRSGHPSRTTLSATTSRSPQVESTMRRSGADGLLPMERPGTGTASTSRSSRRTPTPSTCACSTPRTPPRSAAGSALRSGRTWCGTATCRTSGRGSSTVAGSRPASIQARASLQLEQGPPRSLRQGDRPRRPVGRVELFGYKFNDRSGTSRWTSRTARRRPLGRVIDTAFTWGDDRPPRDPGTRRSSTRRARQSFRRSSIRHPGGEIARDVRRIRLPEAAIHRTSGDRSAASSRLLRSSPPRRPAPRRKSRPNC